VLERSFLSDLTLSSVAHSLGGSPVHARVHLTQIFKVTRIRTLFLAKAAILKEMAIILALLAISVSVPVGVGCFRGVGVTVGGVAAGRVTGSATGALVVRGRSVSSS
jgi:hypothetical protein